MIKLFKNLKVHFFIMPFSTHMDLDFCIFLAICQKSKKSNTYISGERRAERWPNRQKTDVLLNHHTTGRSNKPSRPWFFLKRLSSDCLFTMPAPLILGRIPKCFDTAVWTDLSFWVLVLNPTSHMSRLCYAIQKLFFICYLGNSWPNLFH